MPYQTREIHFVGADSSRRYTVIESILVVTAGTLSDNDKVSRSAPHYELNTGEPLSPNAEGEWYHPTTGERLIGR